MGGTREAALLRAFSEHPIAYFPVYGEITGSLAAGVLLSQISYWWHKVGEKPFYKTDQEFADELKMGLYEFRGAREKLKTLGLVSVERKGMPRKSFYTLDGERLVQMVSSVRKNPTPVLGKTQHWSEEKPNTYKETTTETTTERKDLQSPSATGVSGKSDSQEEKPKKLTKKQREDQEARRVLRLVGALWNKQPHLTHHKKGAIEAALPSVRARLRDGHTLEELAKSIENLEAVIADPECWWTYNGFTLKEFLSRQSGAVMERFLNGKDQFKNKDGDTKNVIHQRGDELTDGFFDNV